MSTPTPEQSDVIGHPITDHARVLAGPGTGKSFTAVLLAARYLSFDPPPSIRFVTFTRTATAELIRKLARGSTADITASTFHAFSISIVMQNPGCASHPLPLRIADVWEHDHIVLDDLKKRLGIAKDRVRDLFAEAAAKWESLEEHRLPKVTPEMRNRFLGMWGQHRSVFGYTLLDELPDLFRRAVEEFEDLKGVDYEALVVDEYQDLNACELTILRTLGQRGVSIIAIGDDDQSIYSFRKAAPEGIRRFTTEFERARDYPLSVCQRCPQNLLDWARHVIEGDANRLKKPVLKSKSQDPALAHLLKFNSGIDEARYIAELITWLHKNRGVSLREILILYRSDGKGLFTRAVRDSLKGTGIDTFDPNFVKNLLVMEQNRRFVALLRLLDDSGDSLAWATLLLLEKGVGWSAIDRIYEVASSGAQTFAEALVTMSSDGFSHLSPTSRIKVSNLYSSLTQWILDNREHVKGKRDDWPEWIRQAVVDQVLPAPTPDFLLLCDRVAGLIGEASTVGAFVSQLKPLGDDAYREKAEAVRILSMSASKGLTVEYAIVLGVDNNLVPSPSSDQFEERRLLYVAMTRATKGLICTWASHRAGPAARTGKGTTGQRLVSDFLRDGPVKSEPGPALIRSLMGS